MPDKIMFDVPEAYERQRGRSSKLLAPLFAEYIAARGRVLDVGCGTGALTLTLAKIPSVSMIVGMDISDGFLGFARAQTDDPRICFTRGDAQRIPYPDSTFDASLALLVMSFVPNASVVAAEMARVTRAGGVVATATWDTLGGNRLNDLLWDAAGAVDPNVRRGGAAFGAAEELASLWRTAGLDNVEVRAIDFACGFESLDDYWHPLLEGQGPAGAYLRGLSEIQRRSVREKLRDLIFVRRSDGPFNLEARAWAVSGVVPGRRIGTTERR